MGLFTVDGALSPEDAPFVDDQRADHDVSEHLAGRENLEAAARADVAVDRATDHHVTTADIALDPAVLTDREIACEYCRSIFTLSECKPRIRSLSKQELDAA